MKVKVIKDLCISCGNCIAICPEVFDYDSEDKAEVIMEEIPDNLKSAVQDAIDSCPTSAIEED